MLFLIGLGLDLGDISMNGISAIRASDELLLDSFTSSVSREYRDYLEAASGKQIKVLSRSDMEENAKSTISAAKEKNIAILVPGDPLTATTHHLILDLSKQMGIDYKIIHSSSIFTAAIGESGLDIYRFGPTATIPFWKRHYEPTSFLEVIKKNMENGFHTLVLLDFNQAEGKSMSAAEACDIIEKAQEKAGKVIENDTPVLLLSDIGRSSSNIVYTTFQKLKSAGNTSAAMNCLIVPSNPNFAEEEAMKKYKTAGSKKT